MAFSTLDEVREAVNLRVLLAIPGVPIVYGNDDDTELSKGEVPYVRQVLNLPSTRQLALGAPKSRRNTGSVVFTIYAPKGTGDGSRDRLYEALVQSFCGEVIGGATFSESRPLTSGNVGNWKATGVIFPYYFDKL